jgi:hypothetical protein
MKIEKYAVMDDGKQKGVFIKNGYSRPMTEEELKLLFGNIRLNTGFSLPDQLIQDFMNDGSIIPTFKRCMNFNKMDLKNMIEPIKNSTTIPRKLPKIVTKKNKKKEYQTLRIYKQKRYKRNPSKQKMILKT